MCASRLCKLNQNAVCAACETAVHKHTILHGIYFASNI